MSRTTSSFHRHPVGFDVRVAMVYARHFGVSALHAVRYRDDGQVDLARYWAKDARKQFAIMLMWMNLASKTEDLNGRRVGVTPC